MSDSYNSANVAEEMKANMGEGIKNAPFEDYNKFNKMFENKKYANMFDCFESFNDAMWQIIGSYYSKDAYLTQIARHQLESYNYFVEHQIIDTINMFNPVKIASPDDFDKESGLYSLEVIITFENFQLNRPKIYDTNGINKLMTPEEARSKNHTYSGVMTIDLNVQYVVRSGQNLRNMQILNNIFKNVSIGKIPIMVQSKLCITSYDPEKAKGECSHDSGGYFIITGSEKVVIAQERSAENKIYCFPNSSKDNNFSWKAEIKSVPIDKVISPRQLIMTISPKHNGCGYPVQVRLQRAKSPIPLFILFRALGVTTDKEICTYILHDVTDNKYKNLYNNLSACAIDAIKTLGEYDNKLSLNQENCIKYIVSLAKYTPMNVDKETGAQNKYQFTVDMLKSDLFPHCQTTQQKIYYLGYMACKLLSVSHGLVNEDNRDSYVNKRLDTTGVSLNNLFRNCFNKFVKDIEKQTLKEIKTGSWRSSDNYTNIINNINLSKIVRSSTLDTGLKTPLSTGNFSVKHANNSNPSAKVGVAQVLNRLSYIGTISHLRRTSQTSSKSTATITAPRKLHSSSFGFICPYETPESHTVGIVKNLSYMTHITVNSNNSVLIDTVLNLRNEEGNEKMMIELTELEPYQCANKVKILINGAIYGIAKNAIEMYLRLKQLKYRGIINVYTSIVFDYFNCEIRICNDAGRYTRPVLKVKNNKLMITHNTIIQLSRCELTWNDLMLDINGNESVIEYIDAEEQSYSLIAMYPHELLDTSKKYTHCEIHPSTMFGIVASCIPFPENNQSPRNTYQSAQQKQAIGTYATNHLTRYDKTSYVIVYPLRPLVDTRIMDLIKINEIPAGMSIVVAIMSYTGYNQEDSLIINQGAIDRGLFLIDAFHTEKDEDKQKTNGNEEIRCKPDKTKTKCMKFACYDKLNSDGLVSENTLIENRDIIISKVVPIKSNKNDPNMKIKFEDKSKMYKTTEQTYIDKNLVGINGDGYPFVKTKLRTMRRPVIGDKFSSRHGQKGTIGNILPEKDMPFTENGLKPDLIINPHAIPSRMTIGQLKETLLGKVLVQLGLFGDGTSFGNMSVDKLKQLLLNCGYESNGNELMYDGFTGEQLEADIFIGPVFYQRLKHMVADKMHSRSNGPTVCLTRQPLEGRSREGGLRFGEMERDAVIAHGASEFVIDRMYTSSDKYEMYVCKECGTTAIVNPKCNIFNCKMCNNNTKFALVKIPYATKLFMQELQGMAITTRCITSE